MHLAKQPFCFLVQTDDDVEESLNGDCITAQVHVICLLIYIQEKRGWRARKINDPLCGTRNEACSHAKEPLLLAASALSCCHVLFDAIRLCFFGATHTSYMVVLSWGRRYEGFICKMNCLTGAFPNQPGLFSEYRMQFCIPVR